MIAAACSSSPKSPSVSSSNSGTGTSSVSSAGGGSSGPTSSASSTSSAQSSSLTPEQLANVNASGSPVTGGTLKIVGNADVDHLDTVGGYYTTTYTLERAFTRQLFANPASTDPAKAISVVPDVATDLPTKANGGLSADGKTYTIHLRPDVMWNTSPARPVTAQDFVLGFKRLCNPTQNSVGAPGYYEGVIVGMTEYCDAFAKVKPDVADFKTFMTTHDISGIKAVDNSTIQFTLVNPASDFPNILTLPFGSAAPVEYLNYLPDSAEFRQHTISDGPYYIASYTAGQSYTLKPNPAWKQSSDPIRHQYLSEIDVTLGPDEAAVQQQIAAGTADMEWDTTVPTADVPQLKATKDPRMGIYANYDTNPFEIFNLQSPNNGGALSKAAVRQALEYAVDKTAIGKIYGGPNLNTPLNQVIPPGNVGYKEFNLYQTPNDAGDPAKCKSLLAAAGYPNGLTLKDPYRTSGKHPDVYQSIQADFAKCGVKVEGFPVKASDFYGKYLSDPKAAKQGAWDIAEPGWVPDWYGNNARAVMEPLFDGRHYGPGSTDWGDYNNDTVNKDIDTALTSTDPAEVDKAMHEADMQVMKDAAFIPFQTQSTPLFHSSRVHNAIELPSSINYDITNVWLSGS
ncbi:MAG: ABC transporter substrate-binding protein [Actinobacteria bacterium]|nr:ABC transporter substrate-binding protein [Actinomycetota bacterium]